jgi:hypothetical protein
VRATAVDAIFIPRECIHEWFDEKPKSVGFVDLKLFEKLPERLRFATAPHQFFEFVADLCPKKTLNSAKVDKVTDGNESVLRV